MTTFYVASEENLAQIIKALTPTGPLTIAIQSVAQQLQEQISTTPPEVVLKPQKMIICQSGQGLLEC